MGNERLSKLQKIILKILYQNNGSIKEPKSYQNRKLYSEVLKQLSGCDDGNSVNKRSVSSSLSRSITNLWKKGYVDCRHYYYGSGLGLIELTSKGYHLLKLEGVNNNSKCYQVPEQEPVNNKGVEE